MSQWTLELDNGEVVIMNINDDVSNIQTELAKYQATMPFTVPGWSQAATKVTSSKQVN